MNWAAVLSALKIGLYAPGGAVPMHVYPYLSAGVPLQRAAKPFNIELGYTEEVRQADGAFLGVGGAHDVFMPAFFAGIAKGVSDDLDVSAGVRRVDGRFAGYFGVSFRVGSTVKAYQRDDPTTPKRASRYFHYEPVRPL